MRKKFDLESPENSAIISEFATRWEVLPIWACAARRILSGYTSHTSGSFLKLDPPGRIFRVCDT